MNELTALHTETLGNWSHNRLIMRVDDPSARDYYLHASKYQ